MSQEKEISDLQPAAAPIDWPHTANEWADAACNAVVWLKNIRDGISTPVEALAEMESNIARIRGESNLHQSAPSPADERAAKPISDEMMDLVDRLGSEYDKVDPRAWRHLLVYAPKPEEMDVLKAPVEMNNWHGRHAYAAGWNDCRKIAARAASANETGAEGVAIPAGWLKLAESARSLRRLYHNTNCNPEGFRLSVEALADEAAKLLVAPQPAQADARIDVEAMLRACVPGGDICDPQRIADSIREWFDEHGQNAAQADAQQIADMIDHLNLLCDELGQYDKIPDEAYGDPYAMSVTFMQLRNAVQRMKVSAQADARVGLTAEMRESVEHAATWLARSEDLQNKAHAERLRAFLNGTNHAE
ncbi:hypothetical protein NTJ56_08605 [Burkholderia contaminans]|uniref:hypothetical protein n=1 Tax=Burkholderia contaminans TaxID=488447 RepID=UPI00215017E7|nr:hypothetical protein [Burkholderia contaminans]UUX38847.1 hypothetical protein NTJ56_08605 [Burkholderia contaminans]